MKSTIPVHRRTAALLLATALLSPAAASGQGVHDPELFNKSAEAALEALDYYRLWDDPEETARLNRIGYAIAQETGFDDYPFSFFLIDMAIPNAFALPAGHIFITRGMLALDLSDDMLAGLLGHEIAHVTQEHFLKMKKRATLFNVLSQVLTVGVMLGASRSDSDGYYDGLGYRRSSSNTADLVQGVAVGGMVVTELLLRSYSRTNEDEADEEGQRFAAAAGFDPDGTRQLMTRMEERLPQEQNFGYWQTHPFFEQRVRAARARKSLLTTQEPSSADDYRRQTQTILLDFIEHAKASPKTAPLLKMTALCAWPEGPEAEALRLEELHQLRATLREKDALSRDYAELLDAYDRHRQAVAALTPQSGFLDTLAIDTEELHQELAAIYPQALEVLDGEVQQTPFLDTFLNNFPASERAAEVALSLGESYARLSREADAVDQFLFAWQADPDGERGQRALRGLEVLTPELDSLSALQQLAEQPSDGVLRTVAASRLDSLVGSYEGLDNGAEFLDNYPDSRYVRVVSERLNRLAEELYKEVILYQRLGEHGKAVEGIQQILTWAPFSDAASRLGESAVVEG